MPASCSAPPPPGPPASPAMLREGAGAARPWSRREAARPWSRCEGAGTGSRERQAAAVAVDGATKLCRAHGEDGAPTQDGQWEGFLCLPASLIAGLGSFGRGGSCHPISPAVPSLPLSHGPTESALDRAQNRQFGVKGLVYSTGKLRQGGFGQLVWGRGCTATLRSPARWGMASLPAHGAPPRLPSPGTMVGESFTTVPGHSPAPVLALPAVK